MKPAHGRRNGMRRLAVAAARQALPAVTRDLLSGAHEPEPAMRQVGRPALLLPSTAERARGPSACKALLIWITRVGGAIVPFHYALWCRAASFA